MTECIQRLKVGEVPAGYLSTDLEGRIVPASRALLKAQILKLGRKLISQAFREWPRCVFHDCDCTLTVMPPYGIWLVCPKRGQQ